MSTDENNAMKKSVTKTCPFRNHKLWKDINFPSHAKDWKQ